MNNTQERVDNEIIEISARIANFERVICAPSQFADPTDAATTNEARDISSISVKRDKIRLKALHQTIQRIKSGDYGWCDSCGEEIASARLIANPVADKCIECASLAEIKKKNYIKD